MWYATSIVAGELLKIYFWSFSIVNWSSWFEIVGWICILHVDAFKHWGWCCPFGAIQYISDAWYGNFRTFVLSLVCDCPYHASTGRIADTFGKLASIVRCLKIVWIWLGGVGYNITSAHYYLVIIFRFDLWYCSWCDTNSNNYHSSHECFSEFRALRPSHSLYLSPVINTFYPNFTLAVWSFGCCSPVIK